MPPGNRSSLGTISGLTPVMARAVGSLLSAMTVWEPLSPNQAQARFHATVGAIGLGPILEGDPIQVPPAGGADLLESSLRVLKTAPAPIREWTLMAALDLALGSGTLPLAQNMALRMAAETLGLPVDCLPRLFHSKTGAELPDLWDPSDPLAWKLRNTRRRATSGEATDWDDAGPYPAPPGSKKPGTDDPRIARIKALALLGLEEGVSQEEIKKAYHRISQVHHPDHYAELGPEAMTEATQSFQRIRAAYDFLLGERSS